MALVNEMVGLKYLSIVRISSTPEDVLSVSPLVSVCLVDPSLRATDVSAQFANWGFHFHTIKKPLKTASVILCFGIGGTTASTNCLAVANN